MTHWSAAFVGLPWADRGRSADGVDCWGLVQHVYRQALGIDLPSYEGSYRDPLERDETSAILSRDAALWPWLPIAAGQQRELDLILLMRGGMPAHVGIVIDARQMLHIMPDSLAAVERYDSGAWRRRIDGFYRHSARR